MLEYAEIRTSLNNYISVLPFFFAVNCYKLLENKLDFFTVKYLVSLVEKQTNKQKSTKCLPMLQDRNYRSISNL